MTFFLKKKIKFLKKNLIFNKNLNIIKKNYLLIQKINLADVYASIWVANPDAQ